MERTWGRSASIKGWNSSWEKSKRERQKNIRKSVNGTRRDLFWHRIPDPAAKSVFWPNTKQKERKKTYLTENKTNKTDYLESTQKGDEISHLTAVKDSTTKALKTITHTQQLQTQHTKMHYIHFQQGLIYCVLQCIKAILFLTERLWKIKHKKPDTTKKERFIYHFCWVYSDAGLYGAAGVAGTQDEDTTVYHLGSRRANIQQTVRWAALTLSPPLSLSHYQSCMCLHTRACVPHTYSSLIKQSCIPAAVLPRGPATAQKTLSNKAWEESGADRTWLPSMLMKNRLLCQVQKDIYAKMGRIFF